MKQTLPLPPPKLVHLPWPRWAELSSPWPFSTESLQPGHWGWGPRFCGIGFTPWSYMRVVRVCLAKKDLWWSGPFLPSSHPGAPHPTLRGHCPSLLGFKSKQAFLKPLRSWPWQLPRFFCPSPCEMESPITLLFFLQILFSYSWFTILCYF